MIDILWNTKGYFFWLLAASLLCFVLERLWPWRRTQKALRPQFGQDLFWLVFNGHYAGILVAHLGDALLRRVGLAGLGSRPGLLAQAPLWAQFAGLLVAKDFVEWCIHRLLHRVPLLWKFHQLHHSIREIDWIGNFRFHWMEIVVYKGLSYLPLLLLGVNGQVILWIAVVSTLIGHLNHANLRIDWGPLRYLLNSARLHVWHHDVELHHPYGQNFAIVFSTWDWLFGTIYYPADVEQPARLGFEGDEQFPRGLLRRLIYPLP
ncbi:MAG TPA: sterol desaturase family protein [Polyangia bacterium]|jgi:sterol desaturase/sphingolipid hydroxylase (fatty acid hydroxylase superfamily)|nr:sterol desaturase family protein [Polyangia bacterium]